jgi:hypothetical protein
MGQNQGDKKESGDIAKIEVTNASFFPIEQLVFMDK